MTYPATILRDYHTHNGYYRGTGEEWSVAEGWDRCCARGLAAYGVANKVEFNHPREDFIPILREAITRNGNPEILLGIELDIADPGGATPFTGANRHLLDYILAAPHNQPVRSLCFADLEPEEKGEYFDTLRDIHLNTFAAVRPTIWAHPFLQELEWTAGHYAESIMDCLAPIAEACMKWNITLEINQNYFRKDIPPAGAPRWWPSNEAYGAARRETLAAIFGYCVAETDLMFSFGSDTHKLEQVGEIEDCVRFAQALSIPASRVLVLGGSP